MTGRLEQRLRVRGWAGCALLAACTVDPPRAPMPDRFEASVASAPPDRPEASTAAAAPAPVQPVEVVALPGQRPPMYVVRGSQRAHPMVFLHGACCHAQGYAQAFQFAAAQRGLLIAPQGDVGCGAGPFSSWSRRIDDLDDRIETAFAALGVSPLGEVTVIGYSLGATRALELVRRRPARYTRLVSMGAPTAPSPAGLTLLRSVVTMAGQRDRQDLMRSGAAAFQRSGIPATFIVLPGAAHGEMGPQAERSMGEALDWVAQHDREPVLSGP